MCACRCCCVHALVVDSTALVVQSDVLLEEAQHVVHAVTTDLMVHVGDVQDLGKSDSIMWKSPREAVSPFQ